MRWQKALGTLLQNMVAILTYSRSCFMHILRCFHCWWRNISEHHWFALVAPSNLSISEWRQRNWCFMHILRCFAHCWWRIASEHWHHLIVYPWLPIVVPSNIIGKLMFQAHFKVFYSLLMNDNFITLITCNWLLLLAPIKHLFRMKPRNVKLKHILGVFPMCIIRNRTAILYYEPPKWNPSLHDIFTNCCFLCKKYNCLFVYFVCLFWSCPLTRTCLHKWFVCLKKSPAPFEAQVLFLVPLMCAVYVDQISNQHSHSQQ